MSRSRLAVVAALGLGLFVVAVDPAAAQASDSATEELIWNLNDQLLYIALPLTLLVEVILVYTVWRFRDNERPVPTRENRRLEITWTIATAIILLFVGVISYQVLASPFVAADSPDAGTDVAPEDEADLLEVRVVAQTYAWNFEYPEENVTTQGTMVLPANRTVRLNVTSQDWLHALHVPDLGLKRDAFPGQSNYLVTRVYETGEYQLYCAEYCGVGHSQMLGTVDVRTPEEFQQWLDENAEG
jgi:cytochrome c oxidase subunit 2